MKTRPEVIAHHLELEDDQRNPVLRRSLITFTWLALGAFMVANLLGYFGQSERTWTSVNHGRVEVHYPRFVREETDAELKIEIHSRPAGANLEEQVQLSREYLEAMRVELIEPMPNRSFSQDGSLVMVFVKERADSTITVRVGLKPRVAGTIQGKIRVGSDEVQFRQFSYL